MKTKIAITLIVALLLSLAGTVEAREYRHDKGGYHRDYATGQHSNKHDRSHAKRHLFRSDHYYRSRHAHHRHKHQGHNSFRHGFGFAADALILGSVVHSINDYGSSQVAYQVTLPDRWYRIDPDGRCIGISDGNQRKWWGIHCPWIEGFAGACSPQEHDRQPIQYGKKAEVYSKHKGMHTYSHCQRPKDGAYSPGGIAQGTNSISMKSTGVEVSHSTSL